MWWLISPLILHLFPLREAPSRREASLNHPEIVTIAERTHNHAKWLFGILSTFITCVQEKEFGPLIWHSRPTGRDWGWMGCQSLKNIQSDGTVTSLNLSYLRYVQLSSALNISSIFESSVSQMFLFNWSRPIPIKLFFFGFMDGQKPFEKFYYSAWDASICFNYSSS